MDSFPSPLARAHLDSPRELSSEAVAAYRRDGHLLVSGALDRDVVLAARPRLLDGLRGRWPESLPPLEGRADAYSRAFVQIVNVGLRDELVGAFTHARRLGSMAGQLMGVRGVRIYCEDWLIKEPGAGGTPWHQDACVFPFDTRASITAWVPIQPVHRGMGLPRFAAGSHRLGLFPVENISEESDRELGRVIRERGLSIIECPPVDAGDVSFHDGLTIHGAWPNDSSEERVVLALHMFVDGAVIKEPTTPSMRHQLDDFARGKRPGDPAATPSWPLIWSANASEEHT